MKRVFVVSIFFTIILIAFGRTNNQFSPYSFKEGLFIQSRLQDRKEQMWLCSYDGINKFKRYSFKSYRTNAGEFSGPDNIQPQKPIKSDFVPRIVFTNFQIFNKNVVIDEEGLALKKEIDITKKLVLTHQQNNFSINFEAIDYTHPKNIRYAYKLEGLETDWNYVHHHHVATYINLPKGNYVFRVKSTNADGVWVDNERSIVIVKEPSFWQSSWGFLFYFIVFTGLVALIVNIILRIIRSKADKEVEQQVNDMKLRFFKEISQELKTPPTPIPSEEKEILLTEPLLESTKEQLTMVPRNNDHILDLITKILNNRKIQNKKIKLLNEPIHLDSFLKEICQNFKNIAEERKINFEVIDDSNNTTLMADKDKFETIFCNFLYYAFKYTQSGNTLVVHITDEQETVSITVKGKGLRMNKDVTKLLLKGSESLSAPNNSYNGETEIRLWLNQKLLELLNATIEIESKPNKEIAFKVIFQKNIAKFNEEDELIIPTTIHHEETEIQEEITEKRVKNKEHKEDYRFEKLTILIVEDNNVFRTFIKSILTKRYKVLEAENGSIALEMAQKSIPDMIIANVMIPEMSGLELAKAVKENINISHIPLILIIDKTDMVNKLEALKCEVDDYISKPFSPAYLEARIENLLKIRKQLQELYYSSWISGVLSPTKPNVISQDDIFIQGIMTYIENNIDNSDLTIDEIANHVSFGRSTFFKKLKSLTGLSPIEFLRDMRIQRAAQLIETGEYNFSEITYMVGISDPRYFSRVFKQKFGISPHEYKDKYKAIGK
jgi:DNA-binding response OmpR family regulator/signal transduction histidine kinase